MADSAGKMYALALVLSLLTIVVTALRFYARRMKQAALSWDDYMILPALLLTIGTAVCMLVGTSIGNLGQHTGSGEDGSGNEIPVFDHRLKVFEQIVFATQLTTTLTFGFTKLSVLLFYKRIFKGTFVKPSVWTMIGVVVVWTLGFFFANLFQCWPLWIDWTNFGFTYQNCINTNAMYLAQAWSDVLTDLIILTLPLPCIWVMQLPARHKAAVSGMFLLGGLTVGAGIAKLVVFNKVVQELDVGFLDISYMNTPLVYWPMVESSMGVVGACLPLLRPLFVGASSNGFMRSLKSVKIASLNLNEDALKQLEDDSPGAPGSTTAFTKFGSESTVVPSNAEYSSYENIAPKAYRIDSLDSLKLDAEKDTHLNGARRGDDYVSTSAQPTRKPWISLQVERFEADAPVKPTRAPRIAPSNLKREGKKTADLRTLPTLGTALEHTVPTQRFTQTGPGVSTLGISSATA
ncbi:hypothetical protein HO173_011102 [Letharia columbiana]|uniref:Rhodopsin domain-containing protein n=1 Tax=Letharia columbiana TaxID=112416 RepID=A0A8H6L025_9LECA|nr:uncharacterized protein HO173_011102 [Letharia columbiana]KAF6230565.1 hypothetical protein HO173_011102 [Letharia columbiana]